MKTPTKCAQCEKPAIARGLCKVHHKRALRSGLLAPVNATAGRHDLSPVERFHLTVDKQTGPVHPVHGRCWPWTGKRNKTGYGRFKVDRKETAAHRFAYATDRGPVPDGLSVLHRCDNPPCCNPAHLFVGTLDDNMADMVAKNRQAKGVGHGRHKLTEDAVLAIFAEKGTGVTMRSVARKSPVTEAMVRLIWRGEKWAHLTGARAK